MYLRFLHVFTGLIAHFFLALSNMSLSRCTTICLSIHLTERYLDCFQILVIMKKKNCYKCLCAGFCVVIMWMDTKNMNSTSHGKSMFHFVRNLSCKVAVPFCIPTINGWVFLLICILISFWCCHLFWILAILVGV